MLWMKHIIVFGYVISLLIGVAAFTIQWLAGKGDQKKIYSVMKPFIGMLLFMNGYDFYIYYIDNITDSFSSNLELSFADCMIAVLVYLWLKVEVSICQNSKCDWVEKIAKWYVCGYVAIWLIAVIFFLDMPWIRLIIDIPLMPMLVIGSAVCIRHGVHGTAVREVAWYKVIITIFMTVNYVTFFINEAGRIVGSSLEIIDFTVFFWLVINIANTVLLYKRDFSQFFLDESGAVPVQTMETEAALELLKNQYELTKREAEILKEVYDGKSNQQIAEELFISESTVKAHVYNLFRKLGVKNRMEAVCMVREEREM